MKSLYEISDKITEEEYRADGKMHYSTLASFDRGGFHSLSTLFDRKESPSLLLGSIVDTLLTDGEDAYNAQYIAAEFPDLSDQIASVIKGLYGIYKESCDSIYDIPNEAIIATLDDINYGKNWKVDTRVGKIKCPAGDQYYNLLALTEGKTLISTEMYSDACKMVDAVRTAPATSFLFAANDPNSTVERFYQLKFSDTVDGIDYSCMMDLAVVLHDKKIVIPCDLKTSSHYEDEFYKSFVEWTYSHQARLYSRLLRARMDKDPYFKNFTLANYHFIVVNKRTLTPLVWEYKDTHKKGTLYYGANNQIEVRDPFVIAKELKYYLENNPSVPCNISADSPNDLLTFLNKMK